MPARRLNRDESSCHKALQGSGEIPVRPLYDGEVLRPGDVWKPACTCIPCRREPWREIGYDQYGDTLTEEYRKESGSKYARQAIY